MTDEEQKVPTPGSPLDMDDLEIICAAIAKRQENFPEEPTAITISLVLLNIGHRFATVECSEGEWKGLKTDLTVAPGEDPKCPNGHDLFITQQGLSIGWLLAEEE